MKDVVAWNSMLDAYVSSGQMHMCQECKIVYAKVAKLQFPVNLTSTTITKLSLEILEFGYKSSQQINRS
jgi:hypothetical protein